MSLFWGGSLLWGLKTGRMPARGVMIDRDKNPAGFQLRVLIYGSFASLLFLEALGLTIWDLLN